VPAYEPSPKRSLVDTGTRRRHMDRSRLGARKRAARTNLRGPTGQGRRDPRLQEGVTLDHVSVAGRTEGGLSVWAICRPGGVPFPAEAWWSASRVNDVADARRKIRGTAITVCGSSYRRSAQQPIQLVQLSAWFPLPIHCLCTCSRRGRRCSRRKRSLPYPCVKPDSVVQWHRPP